MKLYHITHRNNLPSIMEKGLDPNLAKGKRKSVWGVVKTRVEWALVHVLGKPWNKTATLANLVVIEITIPKKNVRRYQTAIWYTISQECIPVTENMVLNADSFGKVRN